MAQSARSVILGAVTTAWCGLVIAGGSGCAPTRPHWREVTDTIKERVQAQNPPLTDYSLSIDYRTGGEVTLTGTADSEADRTRIGQLARSVEGVTQVDNRMVVTPRRASRSERVDPVHSALADDVRAALERELVNSWFTVSIIPSNGELVVSGQADSHETIDAIDRIARQVSKLPVTSNVRLRAERTDDLILSDVNTVLQKTHPALARHIRPTVNHGVVTLNGDLVDHWEIDRTLATVLMVDGVKDVDSRITIHGSPYSSGGRIARKK